MKRFLFTTLLMLFTFTIAVVDVRCKKDESPTNPTPDDGVRTAASTLVRSNQAGLVTHQAGSSISIPQWAVPPSADSSIGEMLFTIEVGTLQQFNLPNTPPTDWTLITDVHSMGPEGFNFEQPVVASIPLPQNFNLANSEVCMFDYNRATDTWEAVGGRLSSDGKSIEVDAAHLCWNVLMAAAASGRGSGAIRFSAVNGYSFKVCIESYQEKYPGWQNFRSANRVRRIDRREASTTPPDGNMYWVLPQGTFNLIIEVYYHDLTLPTEPPKYIGYFRRTIVIDRPHWNWQTGGPSYEFAVPFGDLITNPALLVTDGTRPCFQPTPSVGIGALNVRLAWNAPADIDLWVIDPCGNKIYWDHEQDTCNNSVGRLDLDNWCDNLVLGRPENIFWRSNPPAGLYKVYVHYFDDSGSNCHPTGAGPVYYTVRWTLKGSSFSKSGTLPAVNANVLVTEFTY